MRENGFKISEKNLKIDEIKKITTSMGMLFIELDVSWKILAINAIAAEMTGYASEELTGKNWLDVAVPEDGKEKVSLIRESILNGSYMKLEEAENDVVSLKYKRKTVRWRNLLVCDDSGTVKKILSFGEDITESRVSELIFKILAERKPPETLGRIFAVLEKFISFDRVTLGVAASEGSFRIISGRTAPDAGESFGELFKAIRKGKDTPKSEIGMPEFVKRALNKDEGEYVPETSESQFFEDKMLAKHGWHSRCIVPLISTSNMKIFLAFASRKPGSFGEKLPEFLEGIKPSLAAVVETWYFEEELTRLATIDLLTEVFNRHSILQIIKNEMSRSKRDGKNFSVSMIDIDRFKHFNDTYGHDVGDRVLKKFAQTMKANMREYDVFGRFGGDEFIMIFPNTSGKTAVSVVSRLMKIISSDKIFSKEKVKFSAGIAEFEEGDTETTLLKRADIALYAAKKSSEERVVFPAR